DLQEHQLRVRAAAGAVIGGGGGPAYVSQFASPLPPRPCRHPRRDNHPTRIPMTLATTVTTHQANSVVEQLAAAPAARQPRLPTGFACHAVAHRIAESYENDADGLAGFWIARPRWTVGGRPAARAGSAVVRADGRRRVGDALTRE